MLREADSLVSLRPAWADTEPEDARDGAMHNGRETRNSFIEPYSVFVIVVEHTVSGS
jgi:hypothetical protein